MEQVHNYGKRMRDQMELSDTIRLWRDELAVSLLQSRILSLETRYLGVEKPVAGKNVVYTSIRIECVISHPILA
jgi:hypothetical protein